LSNISNRYVGEKLALSYHTIPLSDPVTPVITAAIYNGGDRVNRCMELKEAHMTDWTKQAEELMKSWTKAQQQLWDTWKSAMPKVGTTEASAAWEKMIEFWKEALDQSLNVQIEWANMWANSVKSQPNVPKEFGTWTDQMTVTMKSWSKSQVHLWESMRDSMKQATPETLMQHMGEGAQVAFQAWRDAVDKAVEAQEELTKHWTGSKSGPSSG
jgi:hypothetical protein